MLRENHFNTLLGVWVYDNGVCMYVYVCVSGCLCVYVCGSIHLYVHADVYSWAHVWCSEDHVCCLILSLSSSFLWGRVSQWIWSNAGRQQAPVFPVLLSVLCTSLGLKACLAISILLFGLWWFELKSLACIYNKHSHTLNHLPANHLNTKF